MTRTQELVGAGAEVRVPHADGSAREVLAVHLGVDPYERIERLRQIGDAKAEAEGLAYQLDHQRKALLASLATEYATTHAKDHLSEAKLERLARADRRYLDHLKGAAAAREQRERLHAEYWALRAELEWDRTAIAHLNALSRLEEPS